MSKLLVKTPIGEFERIEDLVYYDQPILMTIKREEELFLAFFVDYDEETNIDMYLFVPVSENRLEDLKEGKLSCRQAIQNAEQGYAYKMYLSCDEERPSTFSKSECHLIDNDWLPSKDSFLKKNDNEVKEQYLGE